jgi:AcrR family transcriptional regulator
VPSPRASWAGIPVEDRRADRRRALVHAGFELLASSGWSGLTVRAVCQEARLNARYFYESFEDLDALAVAVYDQVVGELAAVVREAQAAAAGDRRSQLRATIDRTVRFVDEDRRRGQVLYVEALGSEPLNRRRLDAGHDLVEAIGRPGGDAGRIGAAVLVGGFTELLVAWLDGRIDLTPDQLVEDATAVLLGVADATGALVARRVER